jgi:hypothetical protein
VGEILRYQSSKHALCVVTAVKIQDKTVAKQRSDRGRRSLLYYKTNHDHIIVTTNVPYSYTISVGIICKLEATILRGSVSFHTCNLRIGSDIICTFEAAVLRDSVPSHTCNLKTGSDIICTFEAAVLRDSATSHTCNLKRNSTKQATFSERILTNS